MRFLSLQQGSAAHTKQLETLAAMVEAFERGKQVPVLQVSTGLIPARLKRYLLESSGEIVRDRYEFMIYRQLRDGLEAGDLHCRDSMRFRSFDDDLVDDETFDQRAELFPRYGLASADRPLREQLEELRERVETRFESVNRRILSGENRFVRVQDHGKAVWERAVRSESPVLAEPFFNMVERLDIDTLLLFIDRRIGFIGANEHESHFVFDILFNNATDILPAFHSTDTHGTNHVNFALLYEFGYCFAPRYRNVQRQVKNGMLGFRHPTHYDKHWPIKPNRRVREGLVLSEETNIERILLSLALKSTTQSVIVGKLSAYRRKNRTKRALWDFGGLGQ